MGLSRSTKASPASQCADLRSAYHECFNRWFSEKFSKGQCDKEECVAEWEKYRACLVGEFLFHNVSEFQLVKRWVDPPSANKAHRTQVDHALCKEDNLEEKHLKAILLEVEETSFPNSEANDNRRGFSHQ